VIRLYHLAVYDIRHILFPESAIGGVTGQLEALFVFTNSSDGIFFQSVSDLVYDLDHPLVNAARSQVFHESTIMSRPRKLVQSKPYRQTRGKRVPLWRFRR
jgi:hypothetical protein